MFVVVDEQQFGPYSAIDETSPVFSPDSILTAYSARKDGRFAAHINGIAQESYDQVFTPVFSPNSSTTAYAAANKGEGAQVVVNGIPGKVYDGIMMIGGGGIVFDSADELHYHANSKDDRLKWYLVTDTV